MAARNNWPTTSRAYDTRREGLLPQLNDAHEGYSQTWAGSVLGLVGTVRTQISPGVFHPVSLRGGHRCLLMKASCLFGEDCLLHVMPELWREDPMAFQQQLAQQAQQQYQKLGCTLKLKEGRGGRRLKLKTPWNRAMSVK